MSAVLEAVAPKAPVGVARQTGGASCLVAPPAQNAGRTTSSLNACTVVARDANAVGHVLTIRGAPGTTGEVSGGPLGGAHDGGFWAVNGGERELTIDTAGDYFVTAPTFPLSMDAEPLGCALDQIGDRGNFVKRVAVDAPTVSWTEGFARSFNYLGTSTAVWIQIDKPGLYKITGNEATQASCEVFKVEGWAKSNVGNGEDKKCNLTRALGAGLHEVRFYGGHPGIETLSVAQIGIGDLSGKKTPAKASCSFEKVHLAAGRYRLGRYAA